MAGLSRLKQFLWITAPLLLPAIGSAVVMTFIRVVGSFGTPAVLGMPVRYFVLPTQIYAAMGTRNAGDGFLLALVLVVLACLFIFINQRLIGVRKSFVTLSGKGFRNKEIADKLSISEQTVKNHLHNIFDKLGVSDRLELALYAIHHKIARAT